MRKNTHKTFNNNLKIKNNKIFTIMKKSNPSPNLPFILFVMNNTNKKNKKFNEKTKYAFKKSNK